MGEGSREDKYSPSVISTATCRMSDQQSHTLTQPWVFIHSLLSNQSSSVLCVPKACVVLSVHMCVYACVCVGGGHLCVIANGMQGHLQCKQVES